MASPLDELVSPLQGTLFPIQVLLMDGDPDVCAEIQQLLERLGYSVIATDSAEATLRLLRQTHVPVDLLVTDAWPEDTLVAMVRESWPELPVLFVSGEPGFGDLPQVAGGRFGFLLRPFAPTELQESILAVLRETPAT